MNQKGLPKYSVIKTGDYYQVQTTEDSQKQLQQQQVAKRLQFQNIEDDEILNGKLIQQKLIQRDKAIKKFREASSFNADTSSFKLDDYEQTLQKLLKSKIKKEEQLEILQLIKEIRNIKSQKNQFPLNTLPQSLKQQQKYQTHRSIYLRQQLNTQKLQASLQSLQNINYVQISRLQHIVQILSGSSSKKQQSMKKHNTNLKDAAKQQIQKIYNSISHLQCINNLSIIINKISANEIKYTEMHDWVNKIEDVNKINRDVFNQLDNDELMLKQLQANFKENVKKVRTLIQKLKGEV